MATSIDYIEYVCEQLQGVGPIRYKKMFGEFMVYLNDKPILIVCDNIPYVKKLKCIEELMQNASVGFPYDGAKEHYILDIDNANFCRVVISEIEKVTPLPKQKKKKN